MSVLRPLRLLFALACLLTASAMLPGEASAQNINANGFGFVPFGFYQPFGAQFQSTIPTPPYFATNPPVYYGNRNVRPYGLSPFAAPPLVQATERYSERAATSFVQPPSNGYPAPQSRLPIGPAPCGCVSAPIGGQKGLVQTNPFVEQADRLAVNAIGRE